MENKAQPKRNYLNFAKANQDRRYNYPPPEMNQSRTPSAANLDRQSSTQSNRAQNPQLLSFKRSNSFGNVSSIEQERKEYITPHEKPISNNLKPRVFNGGTYTKSTMNLTYSSSGSDLDESGNKVKIVRENRPEIEKPIYKKKPLNKSMDNLDEKRTNFNQNSTNDMAEHLLLKFLLQQIAYNQKGKPVPSYKASGVSSTSYLGEKPDSYYASNVSVDPRSNLKQKSSSNLDNFEDLEMLNSEFRAAQSVRQMPTTSYHYGQREEVQNQFRKPPLKPIKSYYQK